MIRLVAVWLTILTIAVVAVAAQHKQVETFSPDQQDVLVMSRQIAFNTAALEALTHDVRELEAWRSGHSDTDILRAEQVQKIATTVDAHEKILWAIIAVVLGLMAETILRFVRKTRN